VVDDDRGDADPAQAVEGGRCRRARRVKGAAGLLSAAMRLMGRSFYRVYRHTGKTLKRTCWFQEKRPPLAPRWSRGVA